MPDIKKRLASILQPFTLISTRLDSDPYVKPYVCRQESLRADLILLLINLWHKFQEVHKDMPLHFNYSIPLTKYGTQYFELTLFHL